jgi:ribonuclease HII
MARWSNIEKNFRLAGFTYIAGADEVGRGPLAGPVVACVVVMPPGARAIAGVADSKELSAAERERLAPGIRRRAAAFALGAASVHEIDRLNIAAATALAILRATRRLRHPYDLLLVDGLPMKHLALEHRAVVDADAKCYSVACASILAKVTRDRLLSKLAARHPGYGWERNSGYGTATHIAALRERGLTAHHRVGFCASALSP